MWDISRILTQFYESELHTLKYMQVISHQNIRIIIP